MEYRVTRGGDITVLMHSVKVKDSSISKPLPQPKLVASPSNSPPNLMAATFAYKDEEYFLPKKPILQTSRSDDTRNST